MTIKLNMSGDTPSDSNVFSEKARVYKCPSGSRPGHYHYTIVSFDGGGIVCTCEGYKYHGKCKHCQSVPACKETSATKGRPCLLPEGHVELAIAHKFVLEPDGTEFEGLPND